MKLPSWMLQDVAEVQVYLGETGWGASYADPVLTRCRVEEGVKVTLDRDGREVLAQVTVYWPAEVTGPDGTPLGTATTLVTPESLVTIHGRTARVLGLHPQTDGGRLAYLQADLA